jgi:hypothetical protein
MTCSAQPPPESTDSRSPREVGAGLFAWSVWSILIVANVAVILAVGRRLPWCDDWAILEVMTGVHPFELSWLWLEHNDHRIPLPKLIWLATYSATDCDFRAPVLLNVALMGVASAWLLAALRKPRGYTCYVDIFIPIVLLRLNNPIFLCAFNLQFTLHVFLSTALLAILLSWDRSAPRRSAALAGLCIILLPLVGSSGLMIAAIMLAWVGVSAYEQWSGRWPGDRRSATLLAVALVLTASLIALYLFNLHRTGYYLAQRAHDIKITILIFVFLLNAPFVTPSLFYWWPVSAIAIPAMFAVATAGLMAAIVRARNGRDLGMLCFMAAQAAVLLAVGWARGNFVWHDPLHYGMLAIPALIWLFFALELYVPPRLGKPIQMLLLLLGFSSISDLATTVASLREHQEAEVVIDRKLRSGVAASEVLETHLDDVGATVYRDNPGMRTRMIRSVERMYLHFKQTGRGGIYESSPPPSGERDR